MAPDSGLFARRASFLFWYNGRVLADPLYLQWQPTQVGLWTTPLIEGVAGVLFSPGRGLFTYSPVMLGAILGAWFAWRNEELRILRPLMLGAALSILLHAKWVMWWGGWSYGPRMLGDVTPVLTLLLIPLVPVVRRRRVWQGVATVAVLWSVTAHAIGAFCDGGFSWNRRVDVDNHPERLWSWRDNPPIDCIRGARGRGSE